MKKRILSLIILIVHLNYANAQKPISKLNKSLFNLTQYNPTPETNFTLRDGLISNTSGTILYEVNGVEHVISTPSQDTVNQPAIHFIKKNDNWIFENLYENAKLHAVRNYCLLDTLGTIAFAEDDDVSKGNLWICKTIGDTLSWQRISTYTAAYSDVSSGDFNGDGLIDVVTYGGIYPNGWMQAFLQDTNGKFHLDPNIIPLPPLSPPPHIPEAYNLGWAVGSEFLLGNTYPEIVKAEYSSRGTSRANETTCYGVVIFSYNPITKAYDVIKPVTGIGIFKDSTVGATSIRFGDFNHDSKKDFAVATENDTHNDIQIFLNDGNDNFIPGQNIHLRYDSLSFREFIVDDFNNDGWADIFLQLFNNGPMTDVVINRQASNQYQYIDIQKCIWMNDNGTLSPLKDSLNIQVVPGFLIGKKVDKNLRLIGYTNDSLGLKYPTPLQIPPNQTTLVDITISFCNNTVKPIFDITNYSFCPGDSVKVSITNANQSDTLKWYWGSKSDENNVSTKTFTDSTNLFVTKTEWGGCYISSDTIQIEKYALPNPPTLTKDSANFLVANIDAITWYKDGVQISDTTQKFKPITSGSYSAKTTQNGCLSLLSQPYYYLTTNLINLNTSEFIKLSPNPFNDQLNLNFIVNGYQRLNMEIFEITTGHKSISKQGLKSGNPILLNLLLPGTYVIKITSNDHKVSYSFKMIKTQ